MGYNTHKGGATKPMLTNVGVLFIFIYYLFIFLLVWPDWPSFTSGLHHHSRGCLHTLSRFHQLVIINGPQPQHLEYSRAVGWIYRLHKFWPLTHIIMACCSTKRNCHANLRSFIILFLFFFPSWMGYKPIHGAVGSYIKHPWATP